MILRIFAFTFALLGAAQAQNAYKSPYSVKFSFPEEELIGDLLKGPRSDWKDHATVPFRDWYNPSNQTRWGYWGPAMRHFNPPAGLTKKTPQWSRERVIATGMRFIGYSYQHHHVPDWEPPADWPRDPEQKTPVGVQVNSAAQAIGTFGKGRVFVSSPHPEGTPGLENLIPRGVFWAAGDKKEAVLP